MNPVTQDLQQDQQQLLNIRRKLYLVIIGAVMVAVLISLAFGGFLEDSQASHILQPVTFLCFAMAFLVLWRKPSYLRTVEVGITCLGVGLTLGLLALLLFVAPAALHDSLLLRFVVWAPIIYPLFYLVFGSKRGLIASLLFLMAVALIGATYGVLVWQASGVFSELDTLLHFYTASIVFIAVSYAFAFFLEQQTAARTKAETVAEYAYQDVLTGLPNRLLLQDRLELVLAHAQRHGESFTVFFLDLDDFKAVNDTYGHHAGDKLLQQVAQRLTTALREADTVARISGDEFAVIAVNVHERVSVSKVARKLLDTYKSPFVIDGQAITITGSIGVSLYPSDGSNPDELLSKADAAMYQAKQLGKNRFYLYKDTVGKETGEYFNLGLHLAKALERNELTLHYQPIFDLTDNRLVGLEALARWQHPDLGSIPPARFIPLAEAHGLIDAIGDWVLVTACRQARAWQDAGYPPLRISVNVSAVQFSNPRFVKRVASILKDTKLEPSWLELEVTESVVAQEAITAYLVELRALGVRVVLDDFGTGYSSLGQLHRLPIDGFKIDRSFMSAARSPQDALDGTRVLVKTVVMLPRGLGLSVVGEGVESQEQVALLQDSGCNIAQGFLLAKPMEAAEVEGLLAAPALQANADLFIDTDLLKIN